MSTRDVHAWLVVVATCALIAPAIDGALPAQQNVPAQKTAGNAGVTGHVVDGDTGAAVPGAVVELTVIPPRSPTAPTAQAAAGSRSKPPTRVLTDADGQFVFKTVPAGSAEFAVTAHNYIGGGYNQLRPDGQPQTLSLADGQHVDHITLKVWKTGAITGRVMDEAGDPVVGVFVRVLRRAILNDQLTLYLAAASRATDDRGVYRASGLPAGDYIVEVPVSRTTMVAPTSDSGSGRGAFGEQFGNLLVANAQGRRGDLPAVIAGDNKLATYPTVFYPASPTSSRATVIALKNSEEKAGVDIQLTLVPAFTVSGVITDPLGLPVGDLQVNLLPVDEQNNLDGVSDSAATSSTGARGEFTMLGVPPGTYQMLVTRAMPPPARGTGPAPTGPQPGLGAWARASVAVSNRDVTEVAMTLHPTLTIKGKAVFDGASAQPTPQQLARGVRLAPSGPGASMDARAGGRGQTLASPISEGGSFSVAGLLPGQYMIQASSWPPLKWIATSITVGGRDASDAPIDVDADLTDVVITFSDTPATLQGDVHRTTGEADSTALVVGFPATARAWGSSGIHQFSTRTTASGGYSLTSLAPGEYLVAAIPDQIAQSWQAPETLKRIAATAAHVTIGDGARLTQNLVTVTVK